MYEVWRIFYQARSFLDGKLDYLTSAICTQKNVAQVKWALSHRPTDELGTYWKFQRGDVAVTKYRIERKRQ